MARVKEDKSRVRLELDGKQAINELGKLEMEAKEVQVNISNIKKEQEQWIKESKNIDSLTEKYNKLTARQKTLAEAGKQSTIAYRTNQTAIDKVSKELETARQASEKLKASQNQYAQESDKLVGVKAKMSALRDELGLSGMTMGQLIRRQRELRNEITFSTTKGTEEYKRLRDELEKVNGTIAQQRAEMNKSGGFFNGLTSQVTKLAGAMGFFVGGAAIVSGFKSLIGVSAEFEQSISNLSALTGATGDELQQLEDAAMRIGGATTLSAQQTADAFTIIASKKPELLENTDALIATTEAAITLAEAAGIELPAAADALTNTLNQFGVGAEEAERFINVLAAGSKFGAGNIEFLNDSIKRFGPIAAGMGISIEQSVSMMEIFAEKGIESEKAGTQFRNILLKLATGADEFNPAMVGMEQAIENLSNANLSATEKVKLFGVENFLAGEILISSGERFTEMTEKVTGTNVALEQARERVNNFMGDMKELTSITGEYAIRIGALITDGLRPFVQAMTAGLHALKETPKFLRENKDLFIALGIALVTFNAQQIIATGLMLKDIAIKKAQAIWTGAVTTAQQLLNSAMTANPIGLVIKAVGLLTAGFVILYNRSEKVRAAIAGIGAVAGEVWNIVKETFGQFIGGFQKILDGNFKDGVADIGKAILKTNPIGLAAMEGKRLAGAFAQGYKDKLADEKSEIEDAAVDLSVDPIIATSGSPIADDAGDGNVDSGKTQLKEKLDSYAKEWEAYQKKIRDISREYALLDLPEQEREIEVNRQKYRDLEEELIKFYENKVITTAEFENQLKEIEEKRLIDVEAIKEKFRLKEEEDKQKALEKIQNTIDPVLDEGRGEDELREKAIAKTNEHYDQLIELANKFGLDTTQIEAARRAALDKIQAEANAKALTEEEKLVAAKINLAHQLSSALGAAINFIGNKSGELTTFQKILAATQIALDTASALGKIIPLAADAAKMSGPAAPFVFAGYIASMGATVLAAAGRASQALGSAQPPSWNDSGSEPSDSAPQQRRGTTAARRSYYKGGPTSDEGLGFGDKFGEFVGYVHKREYVIPEMVTSHPYVANVLPAIEAIRQDKMRGFATGGPTTPDAMPMNQSMMSDPEILQQLMRIANAVEKFPKELEVTGKWDYLGFKKIDEEWTTLEKKYRA